MTGYADQGERVEGLSLQLKGRKFETKIPHSHPTYGFCYPCKTSINSLSSVIQELPKDEQPFHSNSHLSNGDYLKGDTIETFSPKPIKKPAVAKGSGKHKASIVPIRGHSISQITIPARDIL